MMKRFLVLAVAGLVWASGVAWAGSPMSDALSSAIHHAAWANVGRVQFTWEMVPKGLSRSYDWNLETGRVRVDVGGTTVDVAASGVGLSSDEERAAHKAFINDSYWLLFEHRVQTDAVTVTSTDNRPAGVSPDARGISVQYPDAGGYTPGDRYVIWIGADGLSTHWQYFPGNGPEAKFLISREAWVEQGGIRVPTRFRKDGEDFIRIKSLSISPRGSRPQ